jgi:DNA-directed RNA polymerase specialized sigma24 family protein
LCYVEGIAIRQIADAMGRSPKGVEKSLYRVRSWLLDCIHRELNKADMPAPIHPGSLEEEDGP